MYSWDTPVKKELPITVASYIDILNTHTVASEFVGYPQIPVYSYESDVNYIITKSGPNLKEETRISTIKMYL